MPPEEVKSHTREQLLTLLRDPPPVAPGEEGKHFEYAVLRAFELEGASITWPYSVSLADTVVEQIDGVVHLPALACLVESKDYTAPVNIEPIAKLRNQLMRRPIGVVGSVFARNGFTEPARVLAQFSVPHPILLWHGTELVYAIDHKRMINGLQMKYRYAIEHALPDLNIEVELLE